MSAAVSVKYQDGSIQNLIWKHLIQKHGRQKYAARALRVSDSFLSDVLNGRKPPTEAMLTEIGMQRVYVVTYVPICEGEGPNQ